MEHDGDGLDLSDRLDLDAADRAAIEASRGLRPTWTPRSCDFTGGQPAKGIPAGWMVDSWRRRLLYLADACEPFYPERAAELRRQAAGIRR